MASARPILVSFIDPAAADDAVLRAQPAPDRRSDDRRSRTGRRANEATVPGNAQGYPGMSTGFSGKLIDILV
jgi:hypothetical protein